MTAKVPVNAEGLVLVQICYSSFSKQIKEGEAQTDSSLEFCHILAWVRTKDVQMIPMIHSNPLSLSEDTLNTTACSGRPYLGSLNVNLFNPVFTKQLAKSELTRKGLKVERCCSD